MENNTIKNWLEDFESQNSLSEICKTSKVGNTNTDIKEWKLNIFRYIQFFGFYYWKTYLKNGGIGLIILAVILAFSSGMDSWFFNNISFVMFSYIAIAVIILPGYHFYRILQNLKGYEFTLYGERHRFILANKSVIMTYHGLSKTLHPGYSFEFFYTHKADNILNLFDKLKSILDQPTNDKNKILTIYYLEIIGRISGNEFIENHKTSEYYYDFNNLFLEIKTEFSKKPRSNNFYTILKNICEKSKEYSDMYYEVSRINTNSLIEEVRGNTAKILGGRISSDSNYSEPKKKQEMSSNNQDNAKSTQNNKKNVIEKDNSSYTARLELHDIEFGTMQRFKAFCGKCGKSISGGSRGGFALKKLDSDYTSYSPVSTCNYCHARNNIKL
jgi:hypothetical protein